jgi:hypothetical protein
MLYALEYGYDHVKGELDLLGPWPEPLGYLSVGMCGAAVEHDCFAMTVQRKQLVEPSVYIGLGRAPIRLRAQPVSQLRVWAGSWGRNIRARWVCYLSHLAVQFTSAGALRRWWRSVVPCVR